jgi:hypothetical protein
MYGFRVSQLHTITVYSIGLLSKPSQSHFKALLKRSTLSSVAYLFIVEYPSIATPLIHKPVTRLAAICQLVRDKSVRTVMGTVTYQEYRNTKRRNVEVLKLAGNSYSSFTDRRLLVKQPAVFSLHVTFAIEVLFTARSTM